MIAIISLTH